MGIKMLVGGGFGTGKKERPKRGSTSTKAAPFEAHPESHLEHLRNRVYGTAKKSLNSSLEKPQR